MMQGHGQLLHVQRHIQLDYQNNRFTKQNDPSSSEALGPILQVLAPVVAASFGAVASSAVIVASSVATVEFADLFGCRRLVVPYYHPCHLPYYHLCYLPCILPCLSVPPRRQLPSVF